MNTRENKERGTGNRERPETLAEVFAEIRKAGPPFEWSKERFDGWLVRAEAAAKRDMVEAVTRAATAAVNHTNEKWQREKTVAQTATVSGNAAAMRDTHGVTGDGWYGFDLDGTLARYDGWKGIDHIGEPISAIVALIKRLHAEGKVVKIMTARVAHRNDTIDGHNARYYVCKWCAKHLGFTPDVVFQKDARMIQLYDDRVKQVLPNTGILVEDLAGSGNDAALREALENIRKFVGAWREVGVIEKSMAENVFMNCDAALAAPARNCDRFDDDDDAFAAWHDALNDGDIVSVRNAFRWLFATAEKGGAE
jgi:hypothetical protein